MSVILPEQSGRAAAVDRSSFSQSPTRLYTGFRLLGWLGLAFLIMSVIDILLGWYPTRFGSPEWEFGTFSATVAGFSIPTLSLYLMLASATATERARMTKIVGIIFVLFAIVLPIIGVLYITVVPLALKSTATNEVVNFGLKKAMVKTVVLGIGYETLFVLGALQALRRRPSL